VRRKYRKSDVEAAPIPSSGADAARVESHCPLLNSILLAGWLVSARITLGRVLPCAMLLTATLDTGAKGEMLCFGRKR
jgi:hypothetical protein